MGLLSDGRNGSTVEPEAFLDSGLPTLIGRLLGMGCLVAVGTTRDRGAVSIQVTNDGEWEREYFRRSDEAVEWLEYVIKDLQGQGIGSPAARPVPTQKPLSRRTRPPRAS